jgi:protein-arginine kinase activator protein McsA
MTPKKLCEECGNKPAQYGIYKTLPDGEKKWLNVCKGCEKKIGDENMRRAGGYYTGGKDVAT